MNGYLSRPQGKANGKGVLVLQEWWGLVPHIKDVADRFAREGYAAYAPDFWEGKQTKDVNEAERLFMALNIDKAARQLGEGIGALREAGAQGKLGAVGFCLGGQLSLYAATVYPGDVGAVVDFYGIHPNVKPDFSRLKAPLLAIFGEKDPYVTPAAARELEAQVKRAGGHIDVLMYPADHAFFNDTRTEVYDARQAADAWQKTLAFFAKHL
jgi:carboxymethylenebutenolidase